MYQSWKNVEWTLIFTPLDYTTNLLVFLLHQESIPLPILYSSNHPSYFWVDFRINQRHQNISKYFSVQILNRIQYLYTGLFSDVKFTHNLCVMHFTNFSVCFLSFDKCTHSCKPNQDTEYHHYPQKFGHALPTQLMPLTRGNYCSDIFRTHITCVCFRTWN